MTATPLKPEDELTIAANRVSRSAPQQWAEFIKAVELYSRLKDQACIAAPADQVLKAQGKALQIQELLNLFTATPKQR